VASLVRIIFFFHFILRAVRVCARARTLHEENVGVSGGETSDAEKMSEHPIGSRRVAKTFVSA
jgi:hypothetical protein